MKAETNFVAWRDYVPMAKWLNTLWDSHKLTHEGFLHLSALFRSGHSQRKRDALEAQRDERTRSVRDHIAREEAELGRMQPLQREAKKARCSSATRTWWTSPWMTGTWWAWSPRS